MGSGSKSMELTPRFFAVEIWESYRAPGVY